jgi:SAM-dependent methyltransferase
VILILYTCMQSLRNISEYYRIGIKGKISEMPKFVKWVPTPDLFIEPFFELAPVSSSDIVYDLGSGDGRLLFAAMEKGAGKCTGIDIDPEMVKASNETAKNRGLDDRIAFIEDDFMGLDLSPASVVLCYILGSASAALRPKFEAELKPGSRVVMESFPVPGWKPVNTKEVNGRRFYLYIMPPQKTEDYDTVTLDTAYEYDWFYWP